MPQEELHLRFLAMEGTIADLRKELQLLRGNLDEFHEDVTRLRTALAGDLGPGKDHRGVMSNLLTVMNDIYDPEDGLKMRLKRLEESKLKAVGWAAGVGFCAGGIGVVLKAVLDWFKKP